MGYEIYKVTLVIERQLIRTNFYFCNMLKQRFQAVQLPDFLLLITASLLVFMEVIPLILSVFLLVILISLVLQKLKLEYSNWKLSLLAVLPFLLAVFGLFNTSNFKDGLADLSRLLPYFIFPFVFLNFSLEKIKSLKKWILFAVILGTLLKLDFYILQAFIRFISTGNPRHFFYVNLVQETNSLSFFVLISLVFLLLQFREKSMIKLKVIGFSFIAINFIFGLILMQSRLIILASLLITGIFLLLNLKNRARWYLASSISLTLFLLFFPALNGRFKTLPPTEQKSELPESTSSKIDTISCMSSSDLRVNALKSSLAIVQKNPLFGVGTGDWKDELVKKYIELKFYCNANEQTAPHNQYLRTTLKHGFLGLLVLITGFFLLFYKAWQTKNYEKLSYSIALIICLVGYDFVDSGASAPFVAFLSTFFYFDHSERNL